MGRPPCEFIGYFRHCYINLGLTKGITEPVAPHCASAPEAVEKRLLDQAGVSAIHDFHIWSVSTNDVVLTVYLVMPESPADDGFLSS